MASLAGMAKAIVGLIDAIIEPLADKIGGPLGWMIAGVAGFVKAIINKILG